MASRDWLKMNVLLGRVDFILVVDRLEYQPQQNSSFCPE